MNWLIYLNDFVSLIAILINIKLRLLFSNSQNIFKEFALIFNPIVQLIIVSCFFDLLIEYFFFYDYNLDLARNVYNLIYPVMCLNYFLVEKFKMIKKFRLYAYAIFLLILFVGYKFFFGNIIYITFNFGIVGFSMIAYVLINYFKYFNRLNLKDYLILWVGLILFMEYVTSFFVDPNLVNDNKLICLTMVLLKFFLQTVFRFCPAFYFYAIRKYYN